MVEAWLLREEGVFKDIKKEPLREFSEQLAVNLYMNRESRHAEHIPLEELVRIAREWKIPLDDWKLTGRSLLNRDAVGNYKFAHRSIMEYLFVHKFIQGDKSCVSVEWTDQMKLFLKERVEFHAKKAELVPFDITPVKNYLLKYRHVPKNNLQDSSEILHKYGFFDNYKNKNGKGIRHLYETKEIPRQNVIMDYASGLMWQQSGSTEEISYEKAKAYVEALNSQNFASYRDWRLPTLEEAMSLMEPTRKNGNLYIDPVFDATQRWIWTSDIYSASSAWVVDFSRGNCDNNVFYYGNYVRTVR
jgi:hypothetical protein